MSGGKHRAGDAIARWLGNRGTPPEDDAAAPGSADDTGTPAPPDQGPGHPGPRLGWIVTLLVLLLTVAAAVVTGVRAWQEGTQQAMTEFFVCCVLAGLAWAVHGATTQ